MPWRDYYYKVSYKNFYTLVTPKEKQNFVKIFLFILTIYFTSNGFKLAFSFSFFIFIMVSFLYYPMLLRIAYIRDIDVYLNNKSYHLALNQDALHKTHKKYKSPKIFFFTSTKHNFSKEIEEKIAYIEALETYFIDRGKYQPYLNISYHATFVFLFTSILISSLIYFIDSSPIESPNFLFLVSMLFIINIISQGHEIFIDEYAKQYYTGLKKKVLNNYKSMGFRKNYTVIKNYNNDELGRNPTDIVGIIVGVLFSLYVTLIFNKIYPVQTESKIIIDKNVTQYINKIFIEKGK